MIRYFLNILLLIGFATYAYAIEPDSISSEIEYELTSSRDTLFLQDSILVVHTVCAPICSSRVRVYNKEWQLLGVLRPPFRSAFPEAYIQDQRLLWRDNDPFDYTPLR